MSEINNRTTSAGAGPPADQDAGGLPYFPGCTLYTKALGFHESALAVFETLGLPLRELPEWTCCGASYSQVTDNLLTLAGPTRILADAALLGDRLATACAFCFNTLKRTNLLLRSDPEKRKTVTDFIEKEYDGRIEVVHLLQLLRDDLRYQGRMRREPRPTEEMPQPAPPSPRSAVPTVAGWEALYQRVRKPLTDLRVASYYGCLLLRPPKEMAFDDVEDPRIMEDLTLALDAQVVDYPHRTECCGSFLTVSNGAVTEQRAHTIIASALRERAQVIITSCPLCQYNLDVHQHAIAQRHATFSPVPVLYFTQLMALALGLDPSACHFERHTVSPYHALRRWLPAPEAAVTAQTPAGSQP